MPAWLHPSYLQVPLFWTVNFPRLLSFRFAPIVLLVHSPVSSTCQSNFHTLVERMPRRFLWPACHCYPSLSLVKSVDIAFKHSTVVFQPHKTRINTPLLFSNHTRQEFTKEPKGGLLLTFGFRPPELAELLNGEQFLALLLEGGHRFVDHNYRWTSRFTTGDSPFSFFPVDFPFRRLIVTLVLFLTFPVFCPTLFLLWDFLTCPDDLVCGEPVMVCPTMQVRTMKTTREVEERWVVLVSFFCFVILWY